MSRGHVSSLVFNVLIYKNLNIVLRLGIVVRILLREIQIPRKGGVLLFVRLVIGRGGVNLIKQLRRKIQIPRS
jgi:hypothetical protein